MEPKALSRSTRWAYLVLGLGVLLHGFFDKIFLPEIDNLGVALPIGLMFIIMFQSDRIALKLGRRGLIVAQLHGTVMLLTGVGAFFLVK